MVFGSVVIVVGFLWAVLGIVSLRILENSEFSGLVGLIFVATGTILLALGLGIIAIILEIRKEVKKR